MTNLKPTQGLTERTWPSVIQFPISVNGHIITVDSTYGLKVKMLVTLSKPGLEPQEFEIKRVFDTKTLMVGPVGSNIKKVSDAIPYDGGTLYAPEQSRNKLGDSPIIRAVYEEEPTIAIRTIDVTPTGKLHGTPGAVIDSVEPDTRFLYGCAYEATAIREYEPSEKLYSGNAVIDSGASTIALDQLLPWMAKDETFLAMEVDINDNITIIKQFQIVSVDQNTNTISVSPAPDSNYTGEVLLDGSLGDQVKVTNFEYGNAYEVTRMYVTSDTVNEDDILKKLR